MDRARRSGRARRHRQRVHPRQPCGRRSHDSCAGDPFVISGPPGAQSSAAIVNWRSRLMVASRLHRPRRAEQHIYVRRVDTSTDAQVPGPDGARDLAFSPDGRWLAFHAGNKIRKVRVDGGLPTVLADAVHSHGLAWHPTEDAIYFAPHQLSADLEGPGRRPDTGRADHNARLRPQRALARMADDRGRRPGAALRRQRQRRRSRGGDVRSSRSPRTSATRCGPVAALRLHREQGAAPRPKALADERAVRRRPARLSGSCSSGRGRRPCRVFVQGTLAYVPEPDYRRRSCRGSRPTADVRRRFRRRAFGDVALSPDGRRVGTQCGRRSETRRCTSPTPPGDLTPLASQPASTPSWSPDGKWIAGSVPRPGTTGLTVARVPAEAGGTGRRSPPPAAEDSRLAVDTRRLRAAVLGPRFADRPPVADAACADVTPPQTSTARQQRRGITSCSLPRCRRTGVGWPTSPTSRGASRYTCRATLPTARIQVSRDGGAWPQWSKRGDALYFAAGSAIMTAPSRRSRSAHRRSRTIVNDPLLVRPIAGRSRSTSHRTAAFSLSGKTAASARITSSSCRTGSAKRGDRAWRAATKGDAARKASERSRGPGRQA